jgi:hypothetical protein
MFCPVDHPMERGWVGRIDGGHVIHLAAQTIQSFFTGGGSAREHAVYPLASVRLLAPVLHPPAVRVFDEQRSFVFANPAAIVGPGTEIEWRREPGDKVSQASLELRPRIVAIVGAGGALAGFTAFADWRHLGLEPPKDRDFALGLGPVVVTADELDPDGIEAVVRVDGVERLRGAFGGLDWEAARDFAADGTILRPGDILAGPALGSVDAIEPGRVVELEVEIIGLLQQSTSGGQSPFGDSPL